MQFIAFDSHKHHTFASAEDQVTGEVRERKIRHERGELQRFLASCEAGSPVAVETIGNWCWIVDEIEAAGFQPRLVHARKAKMMMGMINKTERLDARGMNRLQWNGTLPVVWIPPGELRDQRDLPRTRMILVRQRTRLKNRIHAKLAKYALTIQGVSDIFSVRGRELISKRMKKLPENTAFATRRLLDEVEVLQGHIQEFEERMESVFEETEEINLLRTLPGVGFTLAVVIAMEVGCVERFGGAEKLASYAGTTPRVHASGGKIRYGQLRPDVNRYLKWAFVEAANSICLNRTRHPQRHVSRLYQRVRSRKGHPKAIGAVARHLAEGTYWILKKRQPYREPSRRRVSLTKG